MSFLHKPPPNLSVAPLLNGYRRKLFDPTHVVKEVVDRVEYNEKNKTNIWIHRLPSKDIFERAEFLQTEYHENKENMNALFDKYPLFGVPFAIRDNMDVKDLPTVRGWFTDGYIAQETAKCVESVISKGGILIGKTDMDLFGFGLGSRNPINSNLISGGISSGSGVAVASNIVSFSLGTDTEGEGRMPAAMNHIYGMKLSKNVISTEGIAPLSPSFDSVSIYTHNLEDMYIVLDNLKDKPLSYTVNEAKPLKFGIPKLPMNIFKSVNEYDVAFQEAINSTYGGWVEIDFQSLWDLSRLAKRSALNREKLDSMPFINEDIDEESPLHELMMLRKSYTDEDVAAAIDQLEQKKKDINDKFWNELQLDFICFPSVAKNYTVKEGMESEWENIIKLELQFCTSWVNLLDWCAIAMPIGIKRLDNGDQPFSATLAAQNMKDLNLIKYSSIIHESVFKENNSVN